MKIVEKWLFLVLLVSPISGLYAEQSSGEYNPAVYSQQYDKPVVEVYDRLYKSLEEARFFVVFEPILIIPFLDELIQILDGSSS